MPRTITVQEIDSTTFKVTVSKDGSATEHRVAVNPGYARKLAGDKEQVTELIRRSFDFLLEREPKEAILKKFDLSVIQKYFPEYEEEIRRM
ncbi:MAG: hypothetical protein ACE5F4_01580 [Candidatus Paceibacteria bacterium]